MSMGIVLMPQVLRDKLGDDGAEALVSLLNETKFVQKGDLDILAERIEKRILEEASKTRAFVVNVAFASVGVSVALMGTIVGVLQFWFR